MPLRAEETVEDTVFELLVPLDLVARESVTPETVTNPGVGMGRATTTAAVAVQEPIGDGGTS